MTPKTVRQLFARLKAENPSPTTELQFKTPFELLVAVVLSAQATDKSVNKVTPFLFKKADTPEKMLRLGVERLTDEIKSIGLFRTKARHLIELSAQLIERHQGIVPNTREDLEKLSGVGRKTANVVLNTAFGEPTIAVDTHIFRVANKTGLARGKNVREVEDALLKAVPDEYKKDAHHWLILHGRYVCTARKPHCEVCVIRAYCADPA
ncbi:MAG: endonuclease III [Burkholderiales bacterium]|jgi:endonuclease-3|nr:endonuclease III [Burkholderiales bacterium]